MGVGFETGEVLGVGFASHESESWSRSFSCSSKALVLAALGFVLLAFLFSHLFFIVAAEEYSSSGEAQDKDTYGGLGSSIGIEI